MFKQWSMNPEFLSKKLRAYPGCVLKQEITALVMNLLLLHFRSGKWSIWSFWQAPSLINCRILWEFEPSGRASPCTKPGKRATAFTLWNGGPCKRCKPTPKWSRLCLARAPSSAKTPSLVASRERQPWSPAPTNPLSPQVNNKKMVEPWGFVLSYERLQL